MYEEELRSGEEVVNDHKKARNKKAARLRELRHAAPVMLEHLGVKDRNEFIKRVVSHEFYHIPFNPTSRNFWEAMKDQGRYGMSPVPQCGDEYYSCCGMEDYYGECRHQACLLAVEYFRAWVYVKGLS